MNRSFLARQRSQRRIWSMKKKSQPEYLITRKEDLRFPLFVIHSDNVDLIDVIIWLEDQVLDDKKME